MDGVIIVLMIAIGVIFIISIVGVAFVRGGGRDDHDDPTILPGPD